MISDAKTQAKLDKLTTEWKEKRQKEIEKQPYSTFLEQDGKLIPVPVKSCFIGPDTEDKPKYLAFVNGSLHPVKEVYKRHALNLFDDES